MLSGTAPVPVSSGRTDRHRLNRLGDRQLNRAIHVIAVNRMRCHPPTQAYVQRRRAEGKTDREIRRCIKRYLARHLYRTLKQAIDKHRSVIWRQHVHPRLSVQDTVLPRPRKSARVPVSCWTCVLYRCHPRRGTARGPRCSPDQRNPLRQVPVRRSECI